MMSKPPHRSHESGIERVSYSPVDRRSQTPIVMLHGMWHGAWCWEHWQSKFAEWGWESHAISLPGHGDSRVERSIRTCTLGYYTQFLADELSRHDTPPIVIGHSMGGGILQNLLHRSDRVAGCVMLASWPHHGILRTMIKCARKHPLATLASLASLHLRPVVNSAKRCRQLFLSSNAMVTPDEMRSKLSADSWLPLLQYNWPLWRPPKTSCPMLWISAAQDQIFSERDGEQSAQFYGAEHITIGDSAHDLMLEGSSTETARLVVDWMESIVDISDRRHIDAVDSMMEEYGVAEKFELAGSV